MPLVAEYHRPDSIDEALSLLADGTRVALAGGTTINADREHGGARVVDLQALGLHGIETVDGRLEIGATTTLDQIAAHPDAPGELADIARAEAPSTLRTLATIGGCVVSRDAESLLLAALLACDGIVDVAGPAEAPSLADIFADGLPAGSLITSVSVAIPDKLASATTARTPADVPIVGAVASRTGSDLRLALTGIAATPVLVDPANPAADLSPPGDFRGSSDYRLRLASVLSARAIKAVQ